MYPDKETPENRWETCHSGVCRGVFCDENTTITHVRQPKHTILPTDISMRYALPQERILYCDRLRLFDFIFIFSKSFSQRTYCHIQYYYHVKRGKLQHFFAKFLQNQELVENAS